MFARTLLPLVCAASIARCMPNPDGTIGAPGGPGWWRSASEDQRMAFVNERCASYGFVAGTPENAQCVGNEYRSLSANTDAAYARFRSSVMAIPHPNVTFPAPH